MPSNIIQQRRDFLRMVGAGAISAALPFELAFNPFSKQRPNVIVILADDLGYGDLPCLGNPVVQTPNLNGFYGSSVRLTNFHFSPVCTPSRAGLLTGRDPVRTGAWSTTCGRSRMRQDEVTMADIFASNGYRTAVFGKWHLGDNYPFRPQDRGFHESVIFAGGAIGNIPDCWGNDYFDDTYIHNGKRTKYKGYCTDVWFDNAMSFAQANRKHPFLVYLPVNVPHYPWFVDEKFSALYKNVKGIIENGVPDKHYMEHGVLDKYYGIIANLDMNIGRLLQQLRVLGLEENTILIFSSDNGCGCPPAALVLNAGMRGTKGSYYDGGHRVPCFIRWPKGKLEGGHNVDTITSHIDILPTLIDLCELQYHPVKKMDGVSIRPLLRGQPDKWTDRTLFLFYHQATEPPLKWDSPFVVMTNRWRLINGKELYDMASDPSEQNDVANKYPEVVQKLCVAYENWWDDVSQRFSEDCPIIIGSDAENPSCLTALDWGAATPSNMWEQQHVAQGNPSNGYWSVDVERASTYEFALRRWPEELEQPITAGIEGGVALNITRARIKISDYDSVTQVKKEDTCIRFQTKLRAGRAVLQTWFDNSDGLSRGAYYVYVKRMKDTSD